MNLKLLLSSALLSSLTLFAGCASQSPAPKTVAVEPKTNSDCETNGKNNCGIAAVNKGHLSSIRVNDYLAASVSGDDGFKYWCKEKAGSEVKLLSVQSYKILKAEESDFIKGQYFTAQISSSTAGGTPITKNWLIGVTSEADGTPCITSLFDPEKNLN